MNVNYYRIEYIIAIDFDGTIVTHDYPRVGLPVPYAKEVINMLAANGHKCFLWTMRDNKTLEDAKKYCKDNDIKLQCYNQSPDQFSNSPKQYATIYIDDAALGCPTSYEHGLSYRPFVDWYKVAEILVNNYPCSITEEQFKSLKK
jgi:hypothetical protein